MSHLPGHQPTGETIENSARSARRFVCSCEVHWYFKACCFRNLSGCPNGSNLKKFKHRSLSWKLFAYYLLLPKKDSYDSSTFVQLKDVFQIKFAIYPSFLCHSAVHVRLLAYLAALRFSGERHCRIGDGSYRTRFLSDTLVLAEKSWKPMEIIMLE